MQWQVDTAEKQATRALEYGIELLNEELYSKSSFLNK